MEQSLLEQLRDIRLPAAPAQDTWQLSLLLIALGLAGISLVVSLWRARFRRLQSWQRDALRELARAGELDDSAALLAAALTLRRCARRLTSDDAARQSTGTAYLQYLDRLFRQPFFVHGPGSVFGEQMYRSTPVRIQIDAAINGLRQLIRNHRS